MKRRNFLLSGVRAAVGSALALGLGAPVFAQTSVETVDAEIVSPLERQPYFVQISKLSEYDIFDEVFAVGESESRFEHHGVPHRIEFTPIMWHGEEPALQVVISQKDPQGWKVVGKTNLGLASGFTVYRNIPLGLFMNASIEDESLIQEALQNR